MPGNDGCLSVHASALGAAMRVGCQCATGYRSAACGAWRSAGARIEMAHADRQFGTRDRAVQHDIPRHQCGDCRGQTRWLQRVEIHRRVEHDRYSPVDRSRVERKLGTDTIGELLPSRSPDRAERAVGPDQRAGSKSSGSRPAGCTSHAPKSSPAAIDRKGRVHRSESLGRPVSTARRLDQPWINPAYSVSCERAPARVPDLSSCGESATLSARRRSECPPPPPSVVLFLLTALPMR